MKLRFWKKEDPRLTGARINSAYLRAGELWPEGLWAVPGTDEVSRKRDADTIRAALLKVS